MHPLLEDCLLRVAVAAVEMVNPPPVGLVRSLGVVMAVRAEHPTAVRLALGLPILTGAAAVAAVERPPMTATTAMAALAGPGGQQAGRQAVTRVAAVPQVVRAA